MTTAPPTPQEQLEMLAARADALLTETQAMLVENRRTLDLIRQERASTERLHRRLKAGLERLPDLERLHAQVGERLVRIDELLSRDLTGPRGEPGTPADPEPLRQELQGALAEMRAELTGLQAEARNTVADAEARLQRAITSVNLLLKGER